MSNHGRQLANSAIEHVIKRHGEGIKDVRVSPHICRHFFAQQQIKMGTDLYTITRLLGHESIQTTMVYLDITTKQEEKALETLEGENQKKMRKKWKTEEGKANLEILLGLTKTN